MSHLLISQPTQAHQNWLLFAVLIEAETAWEQGIFVRHWNCYVPENVEIFYLVVNLNAAAAAKLLQSCPTLCDPIDSSPPGSAVPGILQARTVERVTISFSNA